MKQYRWIALALAVVVSVSVAEAQLGKGNGNGNGNGNPPASSPPPRQNPPASNPPKQNPPTKAPPSTPPREQTPPVKPPKQDPPKDNGNGNGSGLGNVPNPNPRPDRGPASGRNDDRDGRTTRTDDRANDGRLGAPSGQVIGKGSRNNGKAYGGSVSNERNDRSQSSPSIRELPNNRRSGDLSEMVRREDDVRLRGNIYRRGYYHYDNDWRDDYFWSSNYVFDPYSSRDRCAFSPWYYYGHLPAYIKFGNVVIINIGRDRFDGDYYHYIRPNFGNFRTWDYGNRSDLDFAVDDLVTAYERGDRRALSRLMPYRERVNIWLDGRYEYSLNSDDFYDMMLDAVLGTRTTRYDILAVQRSRDEAEVTARHDYIDAWGRRQSVYHWYRLEEDRRGYVITQFGTSHRRW